MLYGTWDIYRVAFFYFFSWRPHVTTRVETFLICETRGKSSLDVTVALGVIPRGTSVTVRAGFCAGDAEGRASQAVRAHATVCGTSLRRPLGAVPRLARRHAGADVSSSLRDLWPPRPHRALLSEVSAVHPRTRQRERKKHKTPCTSPSAGGTDGPGEKEKSMADRYHRPNLARCSNEFYFPMTADRQH